jgi:hypothetical protein
MCLVSRVERVGILLLLLQLLPPQLFLLGGRDGSLLLRLLVWVWAIKDVRGMSWNVFGT